MGETNVEKVPIPTASEAASSNSTEKDEYGKGAAEGAPVLKQESPTQGKSRFHVD